jgi:hypothetical protein
MEKRYTIPVEYDSTTEDYFIQLPDDIIESAGLKIGDTVKWIDNGDGSWSMIKMDENLNLYTTDCNG